MARIFTSPQLVIATHNAGKLREISALLERFSCATVGADALGLAEPEETGASFIANAELKAVAAAKASGLPALADDSGLVVDALDGAPGIYSARWAQTDKGGRDFAFAMARIQRALEEKKARDFTARFVCALALAWPDQPDQPDQHSENFEGRVEAGWFFRRAVLRGLAMTRFLSRKGRRKHLARWTPTPNTPYRTAPMLSRNWSRLVLMPAKPDSLAVYVHWPFCAAICPYCDFNVARFRNVDMEAWARTYRANIQAVAGFVKKRRAVSSIFFGGGTPSLMPAPMVEEIINAIDRAFGVLPDAEVSLEANPSGLTKDALRDLRVAGITRLSLGVQSLDDAALRFLGRQHSAAEAVTAFDAVRGCFAAYSLDVIYARPEQTMAQWQTELAQIALLAPAHASFYQLTFEPNTPLYRMMQAGRVAPPAEARAAALFDATNEAADKMGLTHYEVSNHAKGGCECAHNLHIWRGGDYLGLGPGAHGRIEGYATTALRAPKKWLAGIAKDGLAWEHCAPLTAADRLAEACLTGLRLCEGLSQTRLAEFGISIKDKSLKEGRLADLVTGGFIACNDAIAVTDKGRSLLDSVTAEVYTALSATRDAP